MPNNDYKINYDDAAGGVNTINKTSEGINEIVEKTDKNMQSTLDSEIFSGPLADYALNTWDRIKELAQNNSNDVARSGRSLNNISEAYHQTDQESGERAGNV